MLTLGIACLLRRQNNTKTIVILEFSGTFLHFTAIVYSESINFHAPWSNEMTQMSLKAMSKWMKMNILFKSRSKIVLLFRLKFVRVIFVNNASQCLKDFNVRWSSFYPLKLKMMMIVNVVFPFFGGNYVQAKYRSYIKFWVVHPFQFR